jgi:hypothetical protein
VKEIAFADSDKSDDSAKMVGNEVSGRLRAARRRQKGNFMAQRPSGAASGCSSKPEARMGVLSKREVRDQVADLLIGSFEI